jgi:hypothetical protein
MGEYGINGDIAKDITGIYIIIIMYIYILLIYNYVGQDIGSRYIYIYTHTVWNRKDGHTRTVPARPSRKTIFDNYVESSAFVPKMLWQCGKPSSEHLFGVGFFSTFYLHTHISLSLCMEIHR